MTADTSALAIVAFCLSGYLLSVCIRLRREVKELRSRLDAIEGVPSKPNPS